MRIQTQGIRNLPKALPSSLPAEARSMTMIAATLVIAMSIAGCADLGGHQAQIAPSETIGVTATPGTEPALEKADSRTLALAEAVSAYGATGGIAVILDHEQQWSAAVGHADLAGTAADTGMRFRAGSITKPVVAVLILQLVDEGSLALDQAVDSILPNALAQDRRVTIRHLLDHTSGVFDIGNEGNVPAAVSEMTDPALRTQAEDLMAAYSAGEPVVFPAEIVVAMAESQPRYFPPGQGFHYSNVNYQLAVMVLEQVTGVPWETLLAERIAGPLKLPSFSLAPQDRTSPAFRGVDITIDGTPIDTTDDLAAFGNGGNGGLLATPEHLATFLRSLLRGDLISPDRLEEMTSVTGWSRQAGSLYGLGISQYVLSCGRFWGHEGSVAGTVSIAIGDPSGDRVVVVALNTRTGADPRLPALADRLLCSSD